MIESQKGLSLDRLKTFCLVVRTGSIAAAASNDPSQQSQFSRQIKDLETVLNKKLLAKEGRILKPTAAGLELAALAAAFFEGLDDLSSEPQDKPIIVAAGESILRWLVVPTVSRLTSQAFHWNLRSMRTLQVLEALANGSIDLGVVREDAATEDHVFKDVGSIEYVWAFPRKLLPGQTAAGIYDAKRLPFAFLAGDGKLARQVSSIAEKNHLRLDLCMELESFSLLVEAVKTRNVGAVIPKKAIREFSEAEFAIIDDEQLAIPPRPLLLLAHQKTQLLRPRIRKAFEEFSRIIPER